MDVPGALCSFPAEEVSRKTTSEMKIELAGVTLPEALEAITQGEGATICTI